MVFLDHPLAPQQAKAALCGDWPTVHAFVESEAQVFEVQRGVEQVLGPVPQADVIEPFDPSDPDEFWEFRLVFPGLSSDQWQRLSAQLPQRSALVDGVSIGSMAARDLGCVIAEPLGSALAWVDLRRGGFVGRDVWRDAPVDVRLERRLVEVVRAVHPRLTPRSDRGADTVSGVFDRECGKSGLEVFLGSMDFEGMPGDAVRALRIEIIAALQSAVEGWSDEPQLDPGLEWATSVGGLVVRIWFAAPRAGQRLPTDPVVEPGLTPSVDVLELLFTSFTRFASELEVQVLPGPGAHDAVVKSIEADLLGAMPRWVRTQIGHCFAPVWTTTRRMDVAALQVKGVHGVRVVPSRPVGLSDDWSVIDPHWWWMGGRCFVRYRDAVLARDRRERLVHSQPLPADPELAQALQPACLVELRQIATRGGLEGLEVQLGPESLHPDILVGALRVLSGMRGFAPIATVYCGAEAIAVRLFVASPAAGFEYWD
jgi:hypothetical protein